MKIVFTFGGTPHYYNKILNLIHNKEGYEIALISPEKKSNTIGAGVFQTSDGIDFEHIPLLEYKTWYGKPFFKDYYQTLKQLKPDILVIGWPYFINLLLHKKAVKKLKESGVQVIVKEIPFSIPNYKESLASFRLNTSFYQRQERIFKSNFYFFLNKWIRKMAFKNIIDGAVVYIEKGKEILHSYGLDKHKITVTYNSIVTKDIFETIDQLNAEGLQIDTMREEHHLLHVGRLVKWKRVDLLIEAVAKLKQEYPKVQLSVVGAGPELESLKEQVEKLGLQECIHFKGAVYDSKELAKCFMKAQVYVLAGMGGLSINEAMCYSLPIVCSVCDGTEKHLVYENKNGHFFETDNVQSLTKTLSKKLSDKQTCVNMGKESLRIVESKINEEVVVNAYLDCFNQLKG